MTDTPLTPATDEVPTTIKALNDKVDEVVKNGNEAIAEVRRVATNRERMRVATLLLAAAALVGVCVNGYTIHQRCADDNERNAKQVGLWEFIIGLTADDPPDPGVTPEQQEQRLSEFRAFLRDTFPQRDCWL